MINTLKKRLVSIVLMSFMLSSMFISANLVVLDQISKKNNTSPIPNSSNLNAVNHFYINGTEMYEEGTWYFHLNGSIEIAVAVTADVSEAYFWYEHSSLGGTVNDTLTVATPGFNKTYYFNGLTQTGLYNAKIILKNNTNSFQNFSFYFVITDPDPVVYAVYIRDVTWKNQWTRIYENQIWSTYRNTTLDIVAQVANKDDLFNGLSSVTLGFEDGEYNLWDSIAMNQGPEDIIDGIRVVNYTRIGYIKTDFDSTSGGRDDWLPGSIFSANITAIDDVLNSWIFQFSIKIINRAPKFSEFSVVGGNIPVKSDPGDYVTVIVNSSDLEDDVIYNPLDTTYIENYGVISSSNIDQEGVNIEWNSPIHTIYEIDTVDALSQQVNFIGAGGEYQINFNIGEFYEERISEWIIKMRYWTNQTNNLQLWLLNQTALNGNGSWVQKSGVTFTGNDAEPTWQDIEITFTNNQWNLSDFCTSNTSYQVRFLLNKTGSGNVNFTLDCVNFTYKQARRYSVPKVELYVWGPISEYYQIIDITNFWNTKWAPGNRWGYRYFIANNSIQGAYTFTVRIYDMGIYQITNFLTIRSQITSFINLGRAEQTYLVNYGVTRDSINEVANYGVQISNRQSLDPSSPTQVDITVSDKTNAYWQYKVINTTVSTNAIYTQNGSTYYTIDTNNYTQIPSSSIRSDKSYMKYNSVNGTTNVTLTTAAQQSIIFEYELDDIFWLDEGNITAFRPVWNWYFDSFGQRFNYIRVSFWNWSSDSWSTVTKTNTTNTEFCPLPINQNVPGRVFYTPWINDSIDLNVEDIVNETINNKMLVRFEIVSPSTYAQNLNISINYQAIEIWYNNTFTAQVLVTDENDINTLYLMQDIGHSSSIKQWRAFIPTNNLASKTFAISFILQNGNSSVNIFARRYQSYDIPGGPNIMAAFSEESYYDRNQTLQLRDRIMSSTIFINNNVFRRGVDEIFINGTLSSESRFTESEYALFGVEFRNGGLLSSDTFGFSVAGANFDYDQSTGVWNLTTTFANVRKPGLYYYRLIIESNVSQRYATPWKTFYVLNYQPHITEIKTFNINGIRYREDTLVNFDFQISEVETDVNNLVFEVELPCLDRTVSHNPIIWSRVLITSKLSVGDNKYNITGSFKLGKEINIGIYNNIYLRVTDDDSIQPQKGSQRIACSVDIRNSPTLIASPLASNVTGNSLFRNNIVKLYWNYTDLDDLDWVNNFTFTVFNVRDPNLVTWDLNPSNIQYNMLPQYTRYEYDCSFGIANLTGTYRFTIRIRDPDGATVEQTIDITVNNNLATLNALKIENLATGFYSTLANISNFWIYRTTQQMRVTVNLTDIEDSYQGDTKIKGVYLSIEHYDTIGQDGDPWTNDSRWNTSFTNIKTATDNGNGLETWQVTLSLPILTEFYSGRCILKIHMIDDNNGIGISEGYTFYVNNSAPIFNSPYCEFEINGEKTSTVVNEGTDIRVWIYYSDADYVRTNPNNQLELSKVKVSYMVQWGAQSRIVDDIFLRGEWVVDSSTGAIIVAIDTSKANTALQIRTSEPISIKITKITIYDNDADHVQNDILTGRTSTDLTNINYVINFIPAPFTIPWWVWLLISIVAVGAVVFFVWYYKKYFSYKRYMD